MISIIVPAYNLEKYIARTINSILQQTYKEIEIIVVDDGSTDNTWPIIEELASNYSQISAIHTSNRGVTSARITGVKAARGEWIGFVDGDDIIEVDMYQRLLDNANMHHADISHCGYQMIFSDGMVQYYHNTGCLEKHGRVAALKELLSGARIEPGLWNKLFRKKLFEGILEVMDASIKINEDLLMNYMLFSNAAVSVFEDFCPYHYMVRSSSASKAKISKNIIYDPIKVKQLICDMSCDEMKNDAIGAYISTCIKSYSKLILYNGGNDDKKYIRTLIVEQHRNFYLLNKRKKILAKIIYWVPFLYPCMYLVYSKVFKG